MGRMSRMGRMGRMGTTPAVIAAAATATDRITPGPTRAAIVAIAHAAVSAVATSAMTGHLGKRHGRPFSRQVRCLPQRHHVFPAQRGGRYSMDGVDTEERRRLMAACGAVGVESTRLRDRSGMAHASEIAVAWLMLGARGPVCADAQGTGYRVRGQGCARAWLRRCLVLQ